MEKEKFTTRMLELRTKKGVYARDMSLSLGQCQSYINSLEKGSYYSSMTVFFDICAYLDITPKELFDEAISSSKEIRKLMDAAERMDDEKHYLLTELAKKLVN